MSDRLSSHPAFGAIGDLIRERSGLAFLRERPDELEAGIRRAMERVGVRDPAEFLERLQTSGRVLDTLLEEVTVGETYFFREPEHFRLIRERVLPPLRAAGAADRPVRAWSAGCATGEEAWSLAFVLAQQGLAAPGCVLGTDVSRRALAAAQRAVYRPWVLRACDDGQRLTHFARRGDDFEVADRFRGLVTFRYLNLAADVFPSLANGTWGLDLILCRNVLIYFDRETTRRVLGCFYEALTEGGWLILGSSDPMATGYAPFEPVVTDAGVFYQRRAPARRTSRPAGQAGRPSRRPTPLVERGPALPRPARREGTGPAASSAPAVHDGRAIDEARTALKSGDYALCLRLTESSPGDLASALLRVRATAALRGPFAALVDAARLAGRFPLDAEGHYVYAALLAEAGRDADAEAAFRHVLYLDRTLAVAHVVLATLQARRGDHAGARRSWENARSLCAALPPDTLLPLADGERAGDLAEAAAVHLAMLDRREEAAG